MLVVHFDYTSLASAVAVLRVHQLVEVDPARARSVTFNGIDMLGAATSIPVTLAQLGEIDRFAASAQRVGLHPHRPDRRPPTLAAHTVGALADARGVGWSWREAAMEAYWTHGADLSSMEVLSQLGVKVGLAAEEVESLVEDRHRLASARRVMIMTRQRGVGGVPVLEVDGSFVTAELDDDALMALLDL